MVGHVSVWEAVREGPRSTQDPAAGWGRTYWLSQLSLLDFLSDLDSSRGLHAPQMHCVSLLHHLLQTECPKAECFETLSAMELAEQITLLDHVVFRSIPYE